MEAILETSADKSCLVNLDENINVRYINSNDN